MYTLDQNAYCNQEKQIPLMEIKYYGKMPLMYNYERVGVVALDEFFTFIDDRVVNNIIPNRYSVSTYGRIFDHALGKFITPIDNGTGFHKVKLAYYVSTTEIKLKDVYIARAVKLMFDYIPGAEDRRRSGIEIIHANNDLYDNRLCNLEYVTPQIRAESARPKVSVKVNSLIDGNLPINDPKQPIRIVCSLIQDGYSNTEIADMTNTPVSLIADIRRGHSYTAISKEYTFPAKRRDNAIDTETVIKACEMIQAGERNIDIANALGIKPHVVTEIRSRRNYSYISCNYTW